MNPETVIWCINESVDIGGIAAIIVGAYQVYKKEIGEKYNLFAHGKSVWVGIGLAATILTLHKLIEYTADGILTTLELASLPIFLASAVLAAKSHKRVKAAFVDNALKIPPELLKYEKNNHNQAGLGEYDKWKVNEAAKHFQVNPKWKNDEIKRKKD